MDGEGGIGLLCRIRRTMGADMTAGHDVKVRALIKALPTDERFAWVHVDWASGILVGTRR